MVVKLSGVDKKNALSLIHQTANQAKLSPCYRSKCGAIIVKDDYTLSFGHNAPPWGVKLEYCLKDKIREELRESGFAKGPNDLTCCVHAEKRAIIHAMDDKPQFEATDDYFEGSTLYFVRINEKDESVPSGAPYCTSCAKLALEVGISRWCLWHKEGTALRTKDGIILLKKGVYMYNAREYYDISFNYRE